MKSFHLAILVALLAPAAYAQYAGQRLYSRAAGCHLGRSRDQRKSRPKSVLQ